MADMSSEWQERCFSCGCVFFPLFPIGFYGLIVIDDGQ
jgi:hypothetical protein